jgi:hypothetical protein
LCQSKYMHYRTLFFSSKGSWVTPRDVDHGTLSRSRSTLLPMTLALLLFTYITVQSIKDSHHYCSIGYGCCGSIWTSSDSPNEVIKREDGSSGRSVQNDQIMHGRVIAAATKYACALPVHKPASYELIEVDDKWWDSHINLIPSNTTPCRSYKQEHIPAVPFSVRDLLIERYCRADLQATARVSRDNEDCLIRIYTGRRRKAPG